MKISNAVALLVIVALVIAAILFGRDVAAKNERSNMRAQFYFYCIDQNIRAGNTDPQQACNDWTGPVLEEYEDEIMSCYRQSPSQGDQYTQCLARLNLSPPSTQ